MFSLHVTPYCCSLSGNMDCGFHNLTILRTFHTVFRNCEIPLKALNHSFRSFAWLGSAISAFRELCYLELYDRWTVVIEIS